MNYLLDTNIVLLARADSNRLPPSVSSLLENLDHKVLYSVICVWELSIKYAKGKLWLPDHFFSDLPKLGFDCLPVNATHVETLRTLPMHHHDPFDRMLVAQAHCEKLTLITRDRSLTSYPIKTILV